MNKTYVVAGSGLAGLTVAESLRASGFDGAITLLGAESCAPYHRPPLSKGFLLGTVSPGQLEMRPSGALEKKGIELLTDAHVAGIDRARAHVLCADGRQFAYDGLALCTGARARLLAVPGAELASVFTLRSKQGAQQIQAALAVAQDVVVVGGGFIGLEAAANMRLLGKRVTVLEATDRLMSRTASRAVSGYFEQVHRARGTDVRTSAVVARIEGSNGRATAVHTHDGSSFKADLVLVGIGVLPNDDIAASAGLDTVGGILVDEAARTSDAAIVAAGDCAVRRMVDGSHRRLESVHNAVEQGRAAAASLLGRPAPKPAEPWFYSDQFDTKLRIVGQAVGCDQTVVRGCIHSGMFSAFHFRQGRLLAVESVNQQTEHMRLRRLFERQALPTPEQAADPHFEFEAALA